MAVAKRKKKSSKPEESEEAKATRLKREHYEAIIELQNAVNRSRDKYIDANDLSKDRKKDYEAKLGELQGLINSDPLQPKLWEDQDTVDTKDSKAPWRSADVISLTEEGITEKQCQKLTDFGIMTLGEMQSRMQREGTFWAKEIKGVGEALQTKIEDALNSIVCAMEVGVEEKQEADLDESESVA